ncbi:sulfotransferase family protein [Oceanicola sp. S124]|uniref:sulfotransferase family protein n=1 Tax=Oceanicola sp. S124 TaxID=1042378 RepID=UPI0002557954|nr:sulfotransferase [Oceanicola sp. S124]
MSKRPVAPVALVDPARMVPANPRDYDYSPNMPRLWHGMTFAAWRQMSRGQWANRAHIRPGLFASVTALSLGNSLMAALSQAVHGRALARVRIEPDPVFVLGFWRSGTTWLHQLLSNDPRFTAPTSLQVFMPESFLVLSPVMRRLERLWLPEHRPMDAVALEADTSEEDEVALAVAGAASIIRTLSYGNTADPRVTWDLEGLPEADRQHWRDTWIRFLTKVQYTAPGKQLLLKSPAHTMRIAEVLRQFPNAKFIHIVRDPYAVAASYLHSSEAMTATQTVLKVMPDPEEQLDGALRVLPEFHQAFDRQRHLIPEGNYTLLRYEDLRENTKPVLRQAYADLGLDSFAAIEPGLDRMIEARRGYKAGKPRLPPALAARIEQEWAAYFQRYGYSTRTSE